MTILGVLPLLAWGVASHLLTTRVLSLRPARLDATLARMDERLGAAPNDEALRAEVAEARINLVQAELTRRSLARLVPRILAITVVVWGGLMLVTAALAGRQLARPLEQLASGMARYSAGDLAHRIPEEGAQRPNELQFLVRQFNRMGDELAAQRARLEVSEALAAWQGVARALAHELKNPLTAMRMATARIARIPNPGADESPAQVQTEALALIERQIDTLAHMAQSFGAFAKLPEPVLRPVELRPLVASVCALYSHTSPVPLECEAPPEIVVRADPELLDRALGNLVKNAVEASRAGDPAIRVRAVVTQGLVRIEIADGGSGIGRTLEGPALARALATTKASGSGLGLPLAHKIVHEHGGSLRLDPRPEGGTLATVVLPLAVEPKARLLAGKA